MKYSYAKDARALMYEAVDSLLLCAKVHNSKKAAEAVKARHKRELKQLARENIRKVENILVALEKEIARGRNRNLNYQLPLVRAHKNSLRAVGFLAELLVGLKK